MSSVTLSGRASYRRALVASALALAAFAYAPDARAACACGFVDYTVTITNNGGRAIDSNTTIISDTIAAGTDLFVNTLGGTPAGPVAQTNGATACGLVAASLTVLYSKTVGVLVTDPDTSYAATVTADGNGVDAAVTAIRIKPSGTFAAQSAATAPSCTWRYRVRVE